MVIVIGYSPTPQGRAAVSRGIEEARLYGARLVVVNSSRGDAPVDPRFAQEDDVTELTDALQAGRVEWELEQPVRGREAADEILAAAREHRADLVVIGVRHRSRVGKLIMGSTVQRVLLDSVCPVLTVKG